MAAQVLISYVVLVSITELVNSKGQNEKRIEIRGILHLIYIHPRSAIPKLITIEKAIMNWFVHSFLFLFFFLFGHMDAPRLVIQSELQLPAYNMATSMQDPSRVRLTPHSQLIATLDTRILMDTS